MSNAYDKVISTYNISKNLILDRADAKTFFAYFAIYSTTCCGQDWILRSTEFMENNHYRENCFWILRKNIKIGGCVIYPNTIACFFLISPYHPVLPVIHKLKSLVVSWSDKTKPIYADHIDNRYREDFLRAGFWLNEVRRWMLRPTEKCKQELAPEYEIREPTKDDNENIAKLLLTAYTGGIDEQHFYQRTQSKYSLSMSLDSISDFFDQSNPSFTALLTHSSLIIHKQSSQLVGVCLISLWKEWPLVYELGVAPEFQKQGLATYMLKHALSSLQTEYPVLRLFVTLGNSSEALYYRLGFAPGSEIALMYIPPSEKISQAHSDVKSV